MTIHAFILVAFLVAAAIPAVADSPDPSRDVRPEMNAAVRAIEVLLPLAINESAWADPARRDKIRASLDGLAATAGGVERHGVMRDESFFMLSRSLAADVEDVRHRFAIGQYEASRYLLMQATSNCVTCHQRLPAARDSEVGIDLVANMNLKELPVTERVHLQLLTRRFDEALSGLEAAMKDPRIRPSDLDLEGALTDYLTVGIRVKRNPHRVRQTLEAFQKRADVPRYLQNHVRHWIEDLKSTQSRLDSPAPLVDARDLIRHGSDGEWSALARDTLVPDLVASSLLLRFVDSGSATDAERAEAFYLLGVVEARGLDSPWIPQAAVHLEWAVRLEPGAPFADAAYDTLEEYFYFQYGGVIEDAELPADISTKLKELRGMIDEHRQPPPDA